MAVILEALNKYRRLRDGDISIRFPVIVVCAAVSSRGDGKYRNKDIKRKKNKFSGLVWPLDSLDVNFDSGVALRLISWIE